MSKSIYDRLGRFEGVAYFDRGPGPESAAHGANYAPTLEKAWDLLRESYPNAASYEVVEHEVNGEYNHCKVHYPTG